MVDYGVHREGSYSSKYQLLVTTTGVFSLTSPDNNMKRCLGEASDSDAQLVDVFPRRNHIFTNSPQNHAHGIPKSICNRTKYVKSYKGSVEAL